MSDRRQRMKCSPRGMRSLENWAFLPLLALIGVLGGVLVALFIPLPVREMWLALGSEETLFALRLSLGTSAAATVLALLFGIPSGYLLARRDFAGKQVLDALLDLPLVMPPLVAGVGLLFLLGQTVLGRELSRWGIHFLFTPLGAVAAQTFLAAPIVTRSSKAAFEGVPARYEWAAQTMGLHPLQVFRRITLPMARAGIVSGMILAWARCLGEFGATLMVAGATRMRTETLPIALYLNISSGELGIALSCAWILLAAGFLLLLLLRWLNRKGRCPVPPQEWQT